MGHDSGRLCYPYVGGSERLERKRGVRGSKERAERLGSALVLGLIPALCAYLHQRGSGSVIHRALDTVVHESK